MWIFMLNYLLLFIVISIGIISIFPENFNFTLPTQESPKEEEPNPKKSPKKKEVKKDKKAEKEKELDEWRKLYKEAKKVK